VSLIILLAVLLVNQIDLTIKHNTAACCELAKTVLQASLATDGALYLLYTPLKDSGSGVCESSYRVVA